MVNAEMIDAFIRAHIDATYHFGGGRADPRQAVSSGLEAALAAEAFGLRECIKQTREVYEGYSDVKDALDYLDQLLNAQGN